MKRPALRGVVIRAGATCDPRPLSCYFFEPSALPLPWAFYRMQTLRKFRWLAVKSTAGRPGEPTQPPGIFVCLGTSVLGGANRSLPQSPTKASAPRFNPLKVYGGTTQSTERATNRLKRPDTRAPALRVCFEVKFTTIGRGNPAEKLNACFSFVGTF